MANLATLSLLAELDGAVLVDKPAGIPAHDVMKGVKANFNLVKVGHGGSLDVNASGLFVLLLGKATTLANTFASADREYAGTLLFGRETDTWDSEGNLLAEKDASALTQAALAARLPVYRGDVFQLPPAFSAVKKHGSAQYEVVRTCEEAARTEVFAHLYRCTITGFSPPRVDFSALVSKSFSLRSFAHGLGADMGCGAVLAESRRVRQGALDVKDAIPYMDLVRLEPLAFRSRVIPLARIPMR